MKIQRATKNDLPAIVALLADDELGSKRERYEPPLPDAYAEAFEMINHDPHQYLMVAKNEDDEVISTFQLSRIPYLTYQGRKRAQIEAVRIHKDHRGTGLGRQMINWAIEKAHVVQLTTDKKRSDALRFYESLGFKATHEGMKLHVAHSNNLTIAGMSCRPSEIWLFSGIKFRRNGTFFARS